MDSYTRSYIQITTTASLSYWKDRCKYNTHKVFSVFNSRCLVAACDDVNSPSSGFPNRFGPQLLRLTACSLSLVPLVIAAGPRYRASTRTAQKTLLQLLYYCVSLLPPLGNGYWANAINGSIRVYNAVPQERVSLLASQFLFSTDIPQYYDKHILKWYIGSLDKFNKV
jgi:hypothetical protein